MRELYAAGWETVGTPPIGVGLCRGGVPGLAFAVQARRLQGDPGSFASLSPAEPSCKRRANMTSITTRLHRHQADGVTASERTNWHQTTRLTPVGTGTGEPGGEQGAALSLAVKPFPGRHGPHRKHGANTRAVRAARCDRVRRVSGSAEVAASGDQSPQQGASGGLSGEQGTCPRLGGGNARASAHHDGPAVGQGPHDTAHVLSRRGRPRGDRIERRRGSSARLVAQSAADPARGRRDRHRHVGRHGAGRRRSRNASGCGPWSRRPTPATPATRNGQRDGYRSFFSHPKTGAVAR